MIEAASNHGCYVFREGQLTVEDNSQAGDLSGNCIMDTHCTCILT